MKIISVVFLIFILNGCLYSTKPKPKIQEQIQKQISPVTKKQISGKIKGRIDKIYYENGNYFYEIKATETLNNKLNFAKVSTKNIEFSKGDLVYAIISQGKIINISLISTSQQAITKIQKSDKKRYKSKKIIEIPKVEKLEF